MHNANHRLGRPRINPSGQPWRACLERGCDYSELVRFVRADYREVFGHDPEPWREPLGALRLTLAGDPEQVDVKRAQAECEELVRILNEKEVE